MQERFRFTGESPPPVLWDQFPNWQHAYGEEGLPNQDETTIRPADNQNTIDDLVSFTAGDGIFANGKTYPALLGVLKGQVDWIYVYPDFNRDECWILRFDVPSDQWVAMNDDWFLKGRGILPVPVKDSNVFPVRFTSRLSLARSGVRFTIEIDDPAGPTVGH